MIMQEYGFDIINLIYCSRFIAVVVVVAVAAATPPPASHYRYYCL